MGARNKLSVESLSSRDLARSGESLFRPAVRDLGSTIVLTRCVWDSVASFVRDYNLRHL